MMKIKPILKIDIQISLEDLWPGSTVLGKYLIIMLSQPNYAH
jgi:hypothetical protein